ncbi:MAG: protein phosphatase 2C domain-containing protein [Bacteroidota bacterium]
MKIAIASRTHQGEVRDHNEDDFLVYQDLSNKQRLMPDFAVGRPFSLGQDGTLLVIADGMGGMNAGEVASAKAIEGIEQFMESNGRGVPLKKVKETLFGAIKYANKNIAQHGKENPETQGMGTTLIIAWLRDEKVHCAWVGDSRLYLSRPGQPLLPISKDHSLVQEWVDQGKISYEDAFFDPQNHIVTQSLGDGGQPIYPDYKFFTPKVGDRILVCSDGLNSMIEDKDIDTLVSPPEQTAVVVTNNLVKAARDAGGYDNITIIVAEMREVTPTDILPGEFVVPLPPPIQGQGMIIPEEEGKKKSYDSIFRAFEKRDRTKNMLLFFLVILLVVVIVFAFGSGVKKILGLGGKKSPDLDYVVNTDSLEKRKRIDSLRAVYAEENRIRDSINRANKHPRYLHLQYLLDF